jgi:nucleotide-binding universal stress UspA family protein
MSESHILIPIDFSEQSLIALEQSYNLARFTNSTITLLDTADHAERDASKLSKLAEEIAEKSGHKVNTMIAKGNKYKEIIRVAEEINAIVIIMGFEYSKRIMNIGKNVFQLLRESKCPVITIKGKSHHNGCNNIVVPLDLTLETREKVSKAVEFAKFFNSTVHIISVRLHKDKRHEKKLISYAQQAQKFIKEKGIPCTVKTMEGKDIAELVLDYSREIKADLIMLMSQREVNIKELFSGTTAQKIVNHSDIPVLSIRPMRRKSVARF